MRSGMIQACLRNTMLVASRTLVAGGALQAFHIRCDLDDGPLNVIMADMTSNINVGRDPFLQALVQVMQERDVDIVVGDLQSTMLSDHRIQLLDFQKKSRH